MQQNKSAADRIRPFLKAMERSIDEARSARRQDDVPSTGSAGVYLTPAAPQATTASSQIINDDTGEKPHPSTLKARPKRLAANPFNVR